MAGVRSRSPRPRHHSKSFDRGPDASSRGGHDAQRRRQRDRRSRSPRIDSVGDRQLDTRGQHGPHRDTSDPPKDTHRRKRRRSKDREPRAEPVELPFSARRLSKQDLPAFRALLAYYLDIQKGKNFQEMSEREVKGRWKSFVGKWNSGELAEGWYDPEMFDRASTMVELPLTPLEPSEVMQQVVEASSGEEQASDDEDYGPSAPFTSKDPMRRSGPSNPTLQDLSLRNEMNAEERESARDASRQALRDARKADRKEQKERLDDVAPRAEAGTRERMLEKKQLVNDKMRAFRDKSPGMEAAVDDKELMGGEDSLAEYKRMKEQEQRKKSEREIRREEIDRVKREEMEERRRAWREREEGTVSMLRELAKQRFG